MPNSRANKDSRDERSVGEKLGEYVYGMFNKTHKAEDLVEEDSIGGKMNKAKKARKAAIDKALSE